MRVHRVGERVVNLLRVHVAIRNGVEVGPVARPVTHRLRIAARLVVTRGEFLDAVADADQCLQLGSHRERAVLSPADVERDDADGITRDQPIVLRGVVQGEREHAAQPLQESRDLRRVEGKDDLAVGVGLERLTRSDLCAQLAVVVDLAVDGEHERPIGRPQRLSAVEDVHDGEPFVGHHGRLASPHPAPVGAPVTQQARLPQGEVPRGRGGVLREVEQAEDAAHGRDDNAHPKTVLASHDLVTVPCPVARRAALNALAAGLLYRAGSEVYR
jgi:hypothetical protein